MLPIVLTFAASDPTSGAGLQADVLTLAALGCHPLSVLTGLTVQDTRGVDHLEPIAEELVTRQANCVLAESKVAAFKVGVLASADHVHALAPDAARRAQQRGVEQRLAAHHAQEGLRAPRAGSRPEALAGAAGEDQRVQGHSGVSVRCTRR